MGQIEFDVTHLKNTEWVRREQPQVGQRLPYYKAYATLVVTVDGRNLRYELRLRGQSDKALVMKQECLAAAFQPGTE